MVLNLDLHMIIPEDRLNEILKLYADATLAFVEHGADVNLVRSIRVKSGYCFETEIHSAERCQVPGNRWPRRQDHHRFLFELNCSALAIITSILNDQPEMSRIRSICTAKGSNLIAKCVKLQLIRLLPYRDYEGLVEEEFDLSSEESIEFFALYNGHAEVHNYDTYAFGRDLLEFGLKVRQAHLVFSEEPSSR